MIALRKDINVPRKYFRDCSPEEREVVRTRYGGDLPDGATVEFDGNVLVIEGLNLDRVMEMNAGALPNIEVTLE